MQQTNTYSAILNEVKNLCGLEIDNLKLLLTEKLTLLLAKFAVTSIIVLMSISAFIFLTIALANLLLEYISPALTYCIVSLPFIVIIAIVYFLRKQLIIDPIARYLSTLILTPPHTKNNSTPSSK